MNPKVFIYWIVLLWSVLRYRHTLCRGGCYVRSLRRKTRLLRWRLHGGAVQLQLHQGIWDVDSVQCQRKFEALDCSMSSSTYTFFDLQTRISFDIRNFFRHNIESAPRVPQVQSTIARCDGWGQRGLRRGERHVVGGASRRQRVGLHLPKPQWGHEKGDLDQRQGPGDVYRAFREGLI